MTRSKPMTAPALSIALLVLWASPRLALGEGEPRTVKVATKPVPPFVFDDGGTLSGFSIDLWQELASSLGWKYEFVVKSTVTEVLEAVKSGEADLAVAAISVTRAREEEIDFSQPIYPSGLQVLVGRETKVDVVEHVRHLFTPELIQALLYVAGGLLVTSHLLWLFERRRNPEMFPRGYLAGIWESLWWAMVTLSTVGYGDKVPRGVPGRLLAMIWMLVGIGLVAVFTASVTASLTVEGITGSISGPEDLAGKKVGTVRGTTAAEYLAHTGAVKIEFDRIEDAYLALEKDRVSAVVYDSPVLRYWAAREGKALARVVGPVFEEQDYAIAFAEGSALADPVDVALLGMKQDGDRPYRALLARWFK